MAREKMTQLPWIVFEGTLDTMKEVLDMGRFKFGDNPEVFAAFKSKVMDSFYGQFHKTMEKMERAGLVQKCKCGAHIRKGYNECKYCHGSEHKNSEDLEVLVLRR